LWTHDYLPPAKATTEVNLEIKVHGEGKKLCIISYGNGYYLSRKAQKLLEEQGIDCRVIDLRWLAPLDETNIIKQVAECEKVLIVDECRQTGSISEALMTLLMEKSESGKAKEINRICAQDSFIPLGSAANHVLPSSEEIVEMAMKMCQTKQ